MKILIVARHGEYVSDELDDRGKRQIADLVEKLSPIVGDREPLILSSTAGRAVESAEIIADHFNTSFDQHDVLWSENRHREDLPAALELVRLHQDETEVMILVTHLEYVERFPPYYGQEELEIYLDSKAILKGKAWVIDCEAGTITLI